MAVVARRIRGQSWHQHGSRAGEHYCDLGRLVALASHPVGHLAERADLVGVGDLVGDVAEKHVEVAIEPFVNAPVWVRRAAGQEAERLAAFLGCALSLVGCQSS